MADECDQSQATEELHLNIALQQAGVGKFKLAQGAPGKCLECGDNSARLVRGYCAPCREVIDKEIKMRSNNQS